MFRSLAIAINYVWVHSGNGEWQAKPVIGFQKWSIFERSPTDWATFSRVLAEVKCRTMQTIVTLHTLQSNPLPESFALVNGYRVRVDRAQGVTLFYEGDQEGGKLVASLPVEKWSGDWLIRIIGRFFRLAYQIDTDKSIASIQRNGYLTVRKRHQIGNAKLYERLLIDCFWDYAVSYRGIDAYGQSVTEATHQVKEQLKTRLKQEQAEITLTNGPASRFTEQQLAAFCQANGLIAGGSYTKQQLRQAILRQRKLNCAQFRDQLHYFDIRINCK